jgi:hypothetical protein
MSPNQIICFQVYVAFNALNYQEQLLRPILRNFWLSDLQSARIVNSAGRHKDKFVSGLSKTSGFVLQIRRRKCRPHSSSSKKSMKSAFFFSVWFKLRSGCGASHKQTTHNKQLLKAESTQAKCAACLQPPSFRPDVSTGLNEK